MSKGIILYQSKYGATKKYAEWLKEETGFDWVETRKAKIAAVEEYDTVILGGGVYASGILGMNFLRKNIGRLSGKRIAVFAVGASPYDEEAIRQARERNFKGDLSGIPLFYFRGAWDEDSMTAGDRMLCRMLQKAVARQDPATYEPWQRALMCAVGQKCDWTDRASLRPLLDWLR